MYDAIIIGTGPAGLSAALNLQIYEKNFLWFGSKTLSAKVQKAEKIANYPGLPMVSGEELFAKFSEHIKAADLTITEGTVTSIMSMGDHYMLLADNETYETRTLILATGVMTAKTLAGEDAFLGRGLSYCATCDGIFYKGKRIAVISNDRKYEQEAEYLAELAETVYFFPAYPDSGVKKENVIFGQEIPAEVRGSMKVTSLVMRDGSELAVDGVFCLRNAIAPAKLLPGLETEGPHIVVNRRQETNLPGCYACGDCTGRPYQYTKAVGEGNVAAHSCIEYLAGQKA